MDAALRSFASQGYRATRLDEVAEAAGLTKGAIYYYFESKEDLFRRTIQVRHQAIFAEIESVLEEEGGPASVRLRLALRRIWRHWMEPGSGQTIRLLLGEVSVEFPALFRMWAQEGPIHGWSLIRELIEEGIREGGFRPDVDPEVSARLIVSGLMLQATLHVHLGLDDLAPCDPDRIFDSAVEHFLHGLSVVHAIPGGEAKEPETILSRQSSAE